MSVYDMSDPETVNLSCTFCGDRGCDLYGCDRCGRVMCGDCMIRADDNAPSEWCEECDGK